jgi:hypothetical protein
VRPRTPLAARENSARPSLRWRWVVMICLD